MTPSTLAITVARPVASVAVVAQARARRGVAGPAVVVAADGSVVVADGQLQDALAPPHWPFAGFDGPFAVFANQLAQPPLRIEALPGRSVSGAWVKRRRRCAGRADGGHGVLPRTAPASSAR